MFTGIITAVGSLASIDKRGRGARVRVSAPAAFMRDENVRVGDSIALNGVCTTVTEFGEDWFCVDLSYETLELTCFGGYNRGRALNLEAALRPDTHMGGHIVQGHVDGTGTIASVSKTSEAYDVTVSCPHELMRYIAYKGSITVDGISLTVNDVGDDDTFRLTLIPHTCEVTGFALWRPGEKVNLEADVLARYLEQLLKFKHDAAGGEKGGLTLDSLIANGF